MPPLLIFATRHTPHDSQLPLRRCRAARPDEQGTCFLCCTSSYYLLPGVGAVLLLAAPSPNLIV